MLKNVQRLDRRNEKISDIEAQTDFLTEETKRFTENSKKLKEQAKARKSQNKYGRARQSKIGQKRPIEEKISH